MLSPLPCLAERTPWPGVDEAFRAVSSAESLLKGANFPSARFAPKTSSVLGSRVAVRANSERFGMWPRLTASARVRLSMVCETVGEQRVCQLCALSDEGDQRKNASRPDGTTLQHRVAAHLPRSD